MVTSRLLPSDIRPVNLNSRYILHVYCISASSHHTVTNPLDRKRSVSSQHILLVSFHLISRFLAQDTGEVPGENYDKTYTQDILSPLTRKLYRLRSSLVSHFRHFRFIPLDLGTHRFYFRFGSRAGIHIIRHRVSWGGIHI